MINNQPKLVKHRLTTVREESEPSIQHKQQKHNFNSNKNIVKPAAAASYIPSTTSTSTATSGKLTSETTFQRILRKATTMALFYAALASLPRWASSLPMVNTPFWNWFVSISAGYQLVSMATELYVASYPDWFMNQLNPKSKLVYPTPNDFAIASNTQVTGLVHAIISSVTAVYLALFSTALHNDHMFGSNFFTCLHGVHSSALFFTELLDLLTSPNGFNTTYDKVILLHHTLGTIGFGMSAYGVGNFYSTMILLAEISSVFLSIRWFLLHLNFGHTTFYKVIENTFVATFVGVRIILGYAYLTPIFLHDLLPLFTGSAKVIDTAIFPLYAGQIGTEGARLIARIGLSFGALYHTMNAFFLYQIVRMAIKSYHRNDNSGQKDAKSDAGNVKVDRSMIHE